MPPRWASDGLALLTNEGRSSRACSATRAPTPSRTSASRRVRPFGPVEPLALFTFAILCPVLGPATIVPSGPLGANERAGAGSRGGGLIITGVLRGWRSLSRQWRAPVVVGKWPVPRLPKDQ